jgi:beta-phosphoglucomutase-like phosphatase (HAD superfamily)
MVELVIFDCDGVLVDSDRISLRIQAEWITALALETSYEDCVRDFLGLGMPATLEILGERLGRPVPSGWVDGLEALDKIELPTCVASSGSQEKMRFTLGLTGLWNRFVGRIHSADEVGRGKPAPDLFLHAASSMDTLPGRCVVVEDSPFGVIAARAAGMSALGYTADGDGERLRSEGARTFGSMAELPGLLGISTL